MRVLSSMLAAIGIGSCILALEVATAGKAANADAPSERKVAAFSLPDSEGSVVSLGDFADRKLVVIAVLGTECPLAKLYAPRLAELAGEFGPKGVAFVGIDPNVQDSPDEIARFARENALPFPLLVDGGARVADALGAKRTPEVFVVDGESLVRYHGRVDNQYSVGVQRPAPTSRDLAKALESLLAGREVETAETPVAGCLIGRAPRSSDGGDVTYCRQVSRIFQERCIECHRAGDIGPFALTSYSESIGWGDMIREVVNEKRMPPWPADTPKGQFRNDPRLSDEERLAINAWVDAGCPEGSPEDLPPPREFPDGWAIPKPDVVFYATPKPVQVPAEGAVAYQHFTVDPGFTEDVWINAGEARPGNRGVVHHIIVFVEPPGSIGPIGWELFCGYAPGFPPFKTYNGAGAVIKKGSKLVFQMHYTPNGKPQEDHSYLGIKFADPKDVKVVLKAGMAGNFMVRIPPGADNHPMTSSWTAPNDTLLYFLMPHMHLRGKTFRYELFYPDGRSELLLDVPQWDFNWQIRYELAEPKPIPKGTRMVCSATYDNSANNPNNPDPTKEVRFGEQTWDEMMIGWFATGTQRK